MADLNNCSFTGRLTKDAEKKTLPSGTDLVTFSVANNTGWGDYKKTLYLEVNLWGKTGNGVFPYLKKGKNVAVTGALEVQQWTSAQDGEKKSKNTLNCRECLLLADGHEYQESKGYNPPSKPTEGHGVDDYVDAEVVNDNYTF